MIKKNPNVYVKQLINLTFSMQCNKIFVSTMYALLNHLMTSYHIKDTDKIRRKLASKALPALLKQKQHCFVFKVTPKKRFGHTGYPLTYESWSFIYPKKIY